MISVATVNLNEWKSKTAVTCLFTFENGKFMGTLLGAPLRKQLYELAQAEGFKGSPGQCAVAALGNRKYLLAGLGKKKDYSPESLRRAAGAAYHHAKGRFSQIAVFAADFQAAAEGLLLASYAFLEYRKPEPEKLLSAQLIVERPSRRQAAQKALAKAALYCEAVCLVRDLVNRGPSDKTPQSLAQIASGLKAPGIGIEVIGRERAQQLGMGSFLGVARGSSIDPVFLHLTYKPKQIARKKIGIVGKGITFDSGGLSLKPPAAMETMKMDMAGAASVLGVFKVLTRLKPRAEIHGFCAITYNMPGPDALKPGDVVKAMNGKTIEVLNTDAEGRLVLADALAYACRQKLDCLIDLATLTGAVVTALGSKVTGAMANDKALLRQLLAAGAKADEMFCELPLVPDYKDQIKSSIADLQNIGKVRGEAGSIIGGLFLEEFVEDKPWVHLDIAGTAWNDGASAYCPVGGTGSVVRTILEYLSAL